MSNEGFVLTLAVLFAVVLPVGFRMLPRERWQILASIPIRKETGEHWHGINVTFYGVLTATACTGASGLFVLMTAACGIQAREVIWFLIPLLAVCIPSSRWVARMVEGKGDTFTVQGAILTGTILAPLLFLGLDHAAGLALPVIPLLSAASVSLVMGEGLGRLACISYGCCYGKPLSAFSLPLRKVLRPLGCTFYGKRKKIAYEGRLEGEKVVAVQAITSVLYVCTALATLYLFLEGRFLLSWVVAVFVSQVWRLFCEFLRADYRGEGRFSGYQIMALFLCAATCAAAALLPNESYGNPVAAFGLRTLFSLGPLIALQGLWVLVLLYTGLSRATFSGLTFHVRPDRT